MPDLPSIAPASCAPLGECHDYDGLRSILRRRAEFLNVPRLELDRVSGLANGYVSAILSESGRKQIGPHSLGPLLTALGLKMVIVEDVKATQRFATRCELRTPNMAHTNTRRLGRNALNRAKLVIFEELGRRGGRALFAKMTTAEKTERGRCAALTRWRQYRARKGFKDGCPV